MAKFTNPLDNVKVSSPCEADWNEMIGSDRMRFCGQCKLNVYNLSAMTRAEAEHLIINAEGRLCARFFRRADGTILTKNCPVGWAAAKQRLSRIWTAVASVIFTLVAGTGITALFSRTTEPVAMGEITRELPLDEPDYKGMVMGNVAIDEPFEMGEVAPSKLDADRLGPTEYLK